MITSTISSRSPEITASRTASIASISSCSFLATRVIVLSGTSPVKFTIIIGNSEKFNSFIEYFSAPSGKKASAAFMASRTSAIVLALSQPNSNSIATPA